VTSFPERAGIAFAQDFVKLRVGEAILRLLVLEEHRVLDRPSPAAQERARSRIVVSSGLSGISA
jgi:hypothetical protein